LSLYAQYMWYFSNVFVCLPFWVMLITPIVSFMLPYVCVLCVCGRVRIISYSPDMFFVSGSKRSSSLSYVLAGAIQALHSIYPTIIVFV
jgi:hypothetical protein